jgi:hypothetical protein
MDTELETIAIFNGMAILSAIIGIYFVIKSWILWTRTPDDLRRAKVFLTKRFLYRNFIINIIVIVLLAIHIFLEFFADYAYPLYFAQFERSMSVFYLSLLSISMLLLAILSYHWFILLSSPK